MKLIPLSKTGKNKGKHFAIVDDADFELFGHLNWYAHKSKNDHTYYALRSNTVNGKKGHIKLHNEIMHPDKGFIIDHRDRNGLNCQRSNLRQATKSENRKNIKGSGFSKYLGVSFNKRDKSWVASILVNKRNKSVYCKSEENAATAYNIMAEKYHGQFANYNR